MIIHLNDTANPVSMDIGKEDNSAKICLHKTRASSIFKASKRRRA